MLSRIPTAPGASLDNPRAPIAGGFVSRNLSYCHSCIIIVWSRLRIILLCALFPILYIAHPPTTSLTLLLPICAYYLRPCSFLTAACYHCQQYIVVVTHTRPYYNYPTLPNETPSATKQIQNLYMEWKKPSYAKHKINTNECHKLHT